jgi:hypothetical protein
MLKNTFRMFLSALAVIVVLLPSAASAQSNGLGINPRKDYTIQAGRTINDTLYVSNLSLTQDLSVSIRLVDFNAEGETGVPALHQEVGSPQTPWSIKAFLKYSPAVKVAAGKSAYLPITLSVPVNQGAGSYYSAIEYKAENSETKQRLNLSASSVTLVFINVPGQAKEQLTLKQFSAYQSEPGDKGGFSGVFLDGAPKEMAYRLQNGGNVAEQPSGSIVIRNMFGHTAKEITDANPKKQLVLLGQTRRIQVCIKSSVLASKAPTGQETQQTICDDPGLWPGRYTAQVALYYGMTNHNTKEIMATTHFWYLPIWFIVLVVVLLTGIIVVSAIGVRKFKGRVQRYGRKW